MNREQIKGLFRSLACSQGFYGRLLNDIEELDEEMQEKFWQEMESQNFKEPVDVVMYIEG